MSYLLMVKHLQVQAIRACYPPNSSLYASCLRLILYCWINIGSQTIKVKFQGFTEDHVPSSCLGVLVEQRAEFRPGAGVPEIYDKTLILDSELPLLKRLLLVLEESCLCLDYDGLIMMELLSVLICCKPVILPKTKHRNSFMVE